ncbi:MAG: anaerobic ribonucleoside-triphosphate reductase activating protein [Lachnospiraceae bacterium]|nr:anaerobic ribonucleoside-triphosphate reductase activating protein [Lachnospiraceae bacterium]MBQ4069609.1 anaerobic ribonucleoside-triphosphate reductase activating protein [Lachnospiraceae bacterium]
MIIKGLQKLTLLDYPEKTACTVFTGGCNFRCPFCHNASLVTRLNSEEINEDDFFSFLKKRKNVLQGVCITGGEPTLMPDLPDFICKIKELGYLVKLDSNGYRPEILKQLVNDGLIDYIAMDIKNSESKYSLTAGVPDLNIDKIKESIDFIINSEIDYEFRTTVVKELHSPQDIEDIGLLIKNSKKYFLQSFIDSGDLINTGYSAYTKEEMQQLLEIATQKVTKNAYLRG